MTQTTTRTQPVLVDASVIAEVLGMSKKSVYRFAAEGRLPHIRIGGTIKFDPEVVAEAIVNGGAAT